MDLHSNGELERKFGSDGRSSGLVSQLSTSSNDELFRNATSHEYPKGATLFIEGQPSNGVLVLGAGRVKLLAYSEEGRAIIVRVAEAGEVLGISACIAGVPYEVSAQASASCRVHFIRRDDFLSFLRTNQEAALGVIQELSLLYHAAHYQICSLGLSTSAADKLAKLFLHWSERSVTVSGSAVITLNFTHEEIAEMIGTSRETVTRLIKSFKARDLIRLEGSRMTIPDRANLKAVIGTRNIGVTSLTAHR